MELRTSFPSGFRFGSFSFLRAARTLLRRDRFDDEAVRAFGVEWDAGAGDGFVHERGYGGVVEQGGIGKHDVPNLVAAAFEDAGRIGETRSLKEEEADPPGIKRDREDAIGGAFSRAEADGESVVVVVDELEGGGVAAAHFVEGRLSEFSNFGGIAGNEAGELALGVW